MSIKCGNCKGSHDSVNAVRACYGQPKAAGLPMSEAYSGKRESAAQQQANRDEVAAQFATQHALPTTKDLVHTDDPFGEPVVVNAATEKQVAFIAKLGIERNVPVNTDGITKGEASKEITRLLALPKPARTAPAGSSAAGEPVDGIYVVKGDKAEIFKVYKMVHGSGRQGVKRLDIAADNSGSFTYLGLASSKLPKAAVLMSLEDAKAFGRIYGFCVRCGATLTDEGSIADGIGPVCAGKGW